MRPTLKTALFGPSAIEQALMSDLYTHTQGQTRLLGEVFKVNDSGSLCVCQSHPILDVYYDGGILPALDCAYKVKERHNPTETTEVEERIEFRPVDRNTQKHELLRALLLDRVKVTRWVDVDAHDMQTDDDPPIVEVVGYTFRVDSNGVVSGFKWLAWYEGSSRNGVPDMFDPIRLAEYESYCRVWHHVNPENNEG